MCEAYFQFTDDIYFLEDRLPFKKVVYTIGSVEKNSNLRVNYLQFNTLKYIFDMVKDQELTLEDIQKKLLDGKKIKADIHLLYEYLWGKGLLKNSERKTAVSEVEMIGIHIARLSFNNIGAPIVWICRIIGKLKPLAGIFSAMCIIYLAFYLNTVSTLFREHLYSYNNSAIMGLGVGMAISLIIILIHELAHIVSAINQGMTDLEFNIVLYAGFIPMYYSRYRRMMSLPSMKKVSILSAGIISNVLQIIVAFVIISLKGVSETTLDVLAKFIAVNFYFICINLSPFVLNDGYYMLINVLGISGLRLKMWQYVKGIFNRRKTNEMPKRYKSLFVLYLIFSKSILAVNLVLFAGWIYRIAIEIIR